MDVKKLLLAARALLLISLILPSAGLGGGDSEEKDKYYPIRIISLAPSITETIVALGEGSRLAGVTRYCTLPRGMENVPRVAGFVDYNIEAIASFRPDLVMAAKEAGVETSLKPLIESGLKLVIIQSYTVPEILESITRVGNILGVGEKAEVLVQDIRKKIDAVRDSTKGFGRTKAVWVWEKEPLIVSGRESFGDELIRMAGGENVGGIAEGRFPMMTLEKLVELSPDVIIDASSAGMNQGGRTHGERGFWERFPSISAVKNGRIFKVNSPMFIVPGPRIADALEEVARMVHPERTPQGKESSHEGEDTKGER